MQIKAGQNHLFTQGRYRTEYNEPVTVLLLHTGQQKSLSATFIEHLIKKK